MSLSMKKGEGDLLTGWEEVNISGLLLTQGKREDGGCVVVRNE